MDLSTNYLGFKLRNPIIVGSCGYTFSVKDIKNLVENGASAVVLKSIFEEEIVWEMEHNLAQMQRPSTIYPEIYDFFDLENIEDSVTKYLNLISDVKKEVSVPIIASVNCVSAKEWVPFAKRVENAGADALELNIFIMPSDLERTSEENEQMYFEIINSVLAEVKIPVAVKLSYYFSNLAKMIKRISETGVKGIVLFNRFFEPDFDLDSLTVVPTNVLSNPADLGKSLRWISIMSDRVNCDLCASTGVHDGKAVVKQLLAGAKAVQIASVLYRKGPKVIGEMLEEVKNWMAEKEFDSIEDFRGRLSQSKSLNPAVYERAQFMRYFSEKF
ncbi:MAG: Putative dihydropyrimidine dehydrogenase [NADP+], similar to dihydroorotate dehydrogenase [Candidatus Kapaibacterium sp.]|nr:MAG: Putative dihydropyrimidine dehydrogenase [NADP+], similar to dihydroorotate dehydrogenase [Candidatus Kapabacteria bacterium]